MFKTANTFSNPGSSQSGFASPGAGAQHTGARPGVANPQVQGGEPTRPTKGLRSWLNPEADGGQQRGFPNPLAFLQRRPKGSMPNSPPVFGGVDYVVTPEYDRGASAYVPVTGKVLTNPIGAGIYAPHRPQASYGPSGQYADGAIWWSSQQIPTSVNLAGLTSPDELADILNGIQIQAVVRTTG
jgi:hypothetical protein